MADESLMQRWLCHYDPIHRGFTPKGIANGLTATAGWSFPRIRGGFNLYRGSPTVNDIDYDEPIGAAGCDAAEIRNFSWRRHESGTTYHYAVKSVNGGGTESVPCGRVWPARFDESNDPIGDPPNSPLNLQAGAVSGGRFRLQWTYSPRDQYAAPEMFAIFHDNGTGTVDYEIVRGVAGYEAGRFHFEYLSDAFAHNARRIWAVRAVSGMSVADDNTTTVAAVADAEAPPDHPTAYAECGEEMN